MSRVHFAALCFGAAFGFLFSAAGFNQYDVIHRMLLLQYLDPFFVMGSAVVTAGLLLWLLERRGWRTPLGGVLTPRRWAVERKHLFGGLVFGAGWAVTGACPGTVSAMVAAGSALGLVTLAGVFGGIVLRDTVVEKPWAERADHAPEAVTAERA